MIALESGTPAHGRAKLSIAQVKPFHFENQFYHNSYALNQKRE